VSERTGVAPPLELAAVLAPRRAEAPSEQRGEHGWKVRRLEACPGLVQDPPALPLVADAARGRVEGGLTEERSAKLR
jgi:hypothetical protein